MVDETTNTTGAAADADGSAKQISFRQVYLKDASFESPNTPELFVQQQEGEMKTGIKSLSTNSKRVSDDLWEVVQAITVEATVGEKTAFLCEVQHAGIFELKGFSDEERQRVLGGYCLGLIFPFSREVINNMVTKGSFPALLLPVVNFDDLYLQQQANQQAG